MFNICVKKMAKTQLVAIKVISAKGRHASWMQVPVIRVTRPRIQRGLRKTGIGELI